MNRRLLLVATIALAASPLLAANGPNIVVTALPKGMVQVSGGGATTTDTITVTNSGPAAAAIDLQSSNPIFTLSPSAITLAAGASQVVTIRCAPQPGAVYIASITITGSGVPAGGIVVPMRMMSGPIPAGTVNPQPTATGLILSHPAGQIQQAAGFHNSGNATMQGILVSSVEWIVPQSQLVTVGPSQNASGTFTIDPAKRPDAPSPLGGVTGSLTLRFLNGNGSGGSVSVSIVDVVVPGVAPGDPPQLSAGELALFVPALSRNGVVSDLFLSARRGDPAVTDLRMYYAQAFAGSNSLLASIAQPATGAGAWFPSIVQSVFGRSEQAGSIQLRGGQTTNISIASVQVATGGDNRFFSTALPVLRSDRAAGVGEAIVLTGLEKTNGSATNLYLQEMSGSAATVQTDFFDAAGAQVGSRRSDTVNPFRSVELLDVVPTGARTARVTNTAGGRIGALAMLSDNVTQASWAVVDPARAVPAGTTVWAIPLVASSGSVQADVFMTNGSTSPAVVTLENFSVNPPSRRRAIRTTAAAEAATTLRPLETTRTTMTPSNTMLRFSSTTPAVSATARLTITVSGKLGAFGGSLPVVPVSSALAATQGTRFSGVDDTASGVRSSLILSEVAGGSATVRVTLRFVFVAGLAVSSQGVSTKDFALTGGQMLVVPNLAAEVIGADRNAFGDLRNMQVDIDVIGGGGRVLPFIEGVDASSGNIMIRAE